MNTNKILEIPYPVGTILSTKVNGKWQDDKIDHYILTKNGLEVVLILNYDKQPRLSNNISIDSIMKKWVPANVDINEALSDLKCCYKNIFANILSEKNMTEQEAIDLLRFAFPKEITKPVTEEVISKAVKSLEKQIPKEVSTMKYRNDYDWTCNSCDTTFEYIRYTADKPKYCPNCGQAIKYE